MSSLQHFRIKKILTATDLNPTNNGSEVDSFSEKLGINAYHAKEVQSKLHEPTKATICGQYKKPVNPEKYLRSWEVTNKNAEGIDVSPQTGGWDDTPVPKEGAAWRDEIIVGRENKNKYSYVQPRLLEPKVAHNQIRIEETIEKHHSSKFQHIKSRLQSPTVAFQNGRKEKHLEDSRIPTPTKQRTTSYSTPVTSKYDNIPSRVHEPTQSTLLSQYEWKIPEEVTPKVERESKWNPSVTCINKKQVILSDNITASAGGVLLVGGVDSSELPAVPVNEKYQHVQSRVMNPTTSQIHSQWIGQRAKSPGTNAPANSRDVRGKSPCSLPYRSQSPSATTSLSQRSKSPGNPVPSTAAALRSKSPSTSQSSRSQSPSKIPQRSKSPTPFSAAPTTSRATSGLASQAVSRQALSMEELVKRNTNTNTSITRTNTNSTNMTGNVISIEYLLGNEANTNATTANNTNNNTMMIQTSGKDSNPLSNSGTAPSSTSKPLSNTSRLLAPTMSFMLKRNVPISQDNDLDALVASFSTSLQSQGTSSQSAQRMNSPPKPSSAKSLTKASTVASASMNNASTNGSPGVMMGSDARMASPGRGNDTPSKSRIPLRAATTMGQLVPSDVSSKPTPAAAVASGGKPAGTSVTPTRLRIPSNYNMAASNANNASNNNVNVVPATTAPANPPVSSTYAEDALRLPSPARRRSQYDHIESKLHEGTVATMMSHKSKVVGSPTHASSQALAFTQGIGSSAGNATADHVTAPFQRALPAVHHKLYENIASRLHNATTAYTAGTRKKSVEMAGQGDASNTPPRSTSPLTPSNRHVNPHAGNEIPTYYSFQDIIKNFTTVEERKQTPSSNTPVAKRPVVPSGLTAAPTQGVELDDVALLNVSMIHPGSEYLEQMVVEVEDLELWEGKAAAAAKSREVEVGLEPDIPSVAKVINADPCHLKPLENLSRAMVDSLADLLGNTDDTVFDLRGFEDIQEDAKVQDISQQPVSVTVVKNPDPVPDSCTSSNVKPIPVNGSPIGPNGRKILRVDTNLLPPVEPPVPMDYVSLQPASIPLVSVPVVAQDNANDIPVNHKPVAAEVPVPSAVDPVEIAATQEVATNVTSMASSNVVSPVIANTSAKSDTPSDVSPNSPIIGTPIDLHLITNKEGSMKFQSAMLNVSAKSASFKENKRNTLMNGFLVKKKLGSEKKYMVRYVWLDYETGDLYWSKDHKSKDNTKAKCINLKSNAAVSVVKTKWDNTEASFSIMLSTGLTVKGSSRSIMGKKDLSVDISFVPTLYSVQPSYATSLMEKNATLLYDAIEELM